MNKQINNNSDYKAEALEIVKADFKRTLPYFIINVITTCIVVSPFYYVVDKLYF